MGGIDFKKKALCILIEDLGGEVIIPKDAFNANHVLHYFEDDDKVIIVAEIVDRQKKTDGKMPKVIA